MTWLWRRNGGTLTLKAPAVTLTEATSDLIVELSATTKQLERQVQQLEIKARDSEARITILQGELALANAEVAALECLIQEQAGRIGDLQGENRSLRLSLARVMRKTGTLPPEEEDL